MAWESQVVFGISVQANQNQVPQTEVPCLIGLGANLGNRVQTLTSAIALIANHAGISHVTASHFYETAPIGGPSGQPAFINAAASLDTNLSAQQLLANLREVETKLGRQRHERWSARTIDLDLLLYDDQIIDSAGTVVPHPRLAFRRFVLEPAAEVAPAWVHPPTGLTIAELLQRLDRVPIRVSLNAELNSIRQEIEAALAEFIANQEVAIVDDLDSEPTFAVRAIAERQPTMSTPILCVPADDATLAIIEIRAAIEAIIDRPRRLTV